MTERDLAAYCYFQQIEPRSPMSAAFERDYLLYAVRGALRLNVDGASWLLPPSFAAWIPARTPFVVEIGAPITSCSVLAKHGFCLAFPKTATVFQMSPLARQMIRHCKDWGPDIDHPDEAKGFFLALLNVCGGLVARSVDVKRPFASDPALRRAIEVMEERLSEKLTAQGVAQAVNLSERTMQRRFSEDVGLSWSRVLTHLRMIRAIELLSIDALSIIEIAGDCGFASLSAFNRAFLTFSKMTPSQYRKSLNA
ncbi:AraC family transcriptional regulator [Sulfitobacter sp. F26204]|uniref:AraC family transcriptional regulator n=1 Tax=Sulfitobacter sp. F26204 TaxID=2996014 RepID=UPI00225E1BAA|nr:AraC family transcriptional regulator [Sulfitobacter sp. F26204]MCX7558602.1 AraC family transcriptional regulator [Sulfitobacter sp. F26204]